MRQRLSVPHAVPRSDWHAAVTTSAVPWEQALVEDPAFLDGICYEVAVVDGVMRESARCSEFVTEQSWTRPR